MKAEKTPTVEKKAEEEITLQTIRQQHQENDAPRPETNREKAQPPKKTKQISFGQNTTKYYDPSEPQSSAQSDIGGTSNNNHNMETEFSIMQRCEKPTGRRLGHHSILSTKLTFVPSNDTKLDFVTQNSVLCHKIAPYMK